MLDTVFNKVASKVTVDTLVGAVVALAVLAVVCFGFAVPFMFLWNWAVVAAFGVSAVGYLVSWGVLFTLGLVGVGLKTGLD